MPKKAPKSGFYYFMLDYKENEEKHGKKFPGGLRDVQMDSKCSEAWNALSAHEKGEYNRRAKNRKVTVGKLTGTGESIELLEKQKERQMEYETNMREIIDQSVQVAEKNDNLGALTFYFIHVNHFYTKVSLDENWTDYIPAEYAVVEFSLGSGIQRIHHQIIKTEIQLGYTREYIEHSDTSHKLSNDLAEGEQDYAIMYKNFVEFLNPNKTTNKFPPLYTSRKMKTIVPCLFKRMTEAADVDTMTFDLYSLEYLFGALMETVNIQFPENISRVILAEAQLNKDAFYWTPNIECFYHIGIEGTGPYCSQSVVQQWAFTIADYCCPKLSINMIPGAHCPPSLDGLISDFENMKVQKISTFKSDTGVSEAYRLMVGSRTREEEELRRNQCKPVKIIDFGKNTVSSSTVNYATASSTTSRVVPQKQMRTPKTMATVFASQDAPIMNDDNFPAIGGRGKSRSGKPNLSKPTEGRGRGSIIMN